MNATIQTNKTNLWQQPVGRRSIFKNCARVNDGSFNLYPIEKEKQIMKLTTVIAFNATLIFLVIAAFSQNEQQQEMDTHLNKQMMKMMKDSSMVSMMMDSIA